MYFMPKKELPCRLVLFFNKCILFALHHYQHLNAFDCCAIETWSYIWSCLSSGEITEGSKVCAWHRTTCIKYEYMLTNNMRVRIVCFVPTCHYNCIDRYVQLLQAHCLISHPRHICCLSLLLSIHGSSNEEHNPFMLLCVCVCLSQVRAWDSHFAE